MAGERLATQTLYVTQYQLSDGSWVDLWLGGQARRFTAAMNDGHSAVPLNTPNRFHIMTVYNVSPDQLQRTTVESFIYALQQFLGASGLDSHYTVAPVTAVYGSQSETIGCLIQATSYDAAYDFQFPVCSQVYQTGGTGFSWNSTLTNTIRPVLLTAAITHNQVFGTATGTIAITATNGTAGTYTYGWADAGAPLLASRSGLAAGTYTVTVTDGSGASASLANVVRSDDRLDVLVDRTDNNVTLVPSGGVPPYTYLWTDGPTTATRSALGVGTYRCTVTDGHGATRLVELTVEPYRFYWSKNPVTLALDAGAAYRLDPTTKPNLSFVCEVWVEEVYRSGTFVRLGPVQEQPADRFGRTVFDAQALLDGYLSEHLPALNQAQPSRADCLFRRFYFRYAEKFGAVPVAAALSNQAQHYVVLGGLDDYAAAGTWFASYQAGAKPFLTWEPDNKPVLPTQPEYLYFMADSFALASFRVQVQVRYVNNTTAALTLATVTGVNRFEVFCLPVGYAQLGLVADAGPAVASWEVWVSDAAGVAQTERRRFVLNPDYVAKPRYFLYTNSLGAVSTFACVGEAKTALDVKAEEADRPAGGDPLLGDVLTTDRSGVLTLSVSSGSLLRAQLVAVQDFLLSTRVVLQTDAAYFPGRVKVKSVPLLDEAPGEQKALEFDFLLPRQRQFTPRLPATGAGRAVVPVRGGEGAQP
ncbi:MAG: hypothetical protein JWP58_3921 [Hymenobacter sp.]|nr:hypothetical protein [Hymenobacter sp.]